MSSSSHSTSTLRQPIRKAVFPIAGLGTRLSPVTKVTPKEMLTLNDRPLLQHVIDEALEAGIEEFIFVVGQNRKILEEYLNSQADITQIEKTREKTELVLQRPDSDTPTAKIIITLQSRPLGLGHAISCAKNFIGRDPFAIILSDDLVQHQKGCLAQMIEVYNQQGGNIIAIKNIPKEDTSKYGIIESGDEENNIITVKGLVEKPTPDEAPSTLCIIGRYILSPKILDYLANAKAGVNNEIQLTDSMAKLINDQPFYGLKFEGQHFDCGSRLGLIEANIAYSLADPEIGNDVRAMLQRLS